MSILVRDLISTQVRWNLGFPMDIQKAREYMLNSFVNLSNLSADISYNFRYVF
jgi:hypothetical protein